MVQREALPKSLQSPVLWTVALPLGLALLFGAPKPGVSLRALLSTIRAHPGDPSAHTCMLDSRLSPPTFPAGATPRSCFRWGPVTIFPRVLEESKW